MKILRILLLAICSLSIGHSHGQYKWKLEKDQDGISVYLSDMPGSNFKAVKVECTFTGTYTKLISVLTDIPRFSEWIYRNKTSLLIKKNTAYDMIYYSQTRMPWPLSNRDVVIHLRIKTDSLPKFLTITGINEKGDIVPTIPSIVRVPHYKANWYVTMPTAATIRISYILEIDPGGSIPASIANSYADKGPFETFTNLAKELKR